MCQLLTPYHRLTQISTVLIGRFIWCLSKTDLLSNRVHRATRLIDPVDRQRLNVRTRVPWSRAQSEAWPVGAPPNGDPLDVLWNN